MTYINKLGKEYQLWKYDIILKGGKTSSIYFYLPINQKPTASRYGKAKKLDFLPDTYKVREIGKSHTPLVSKKKIRIVISGCDDTTYIDEKDWGMNFSYDELEIIGKLADLSEKKSSYKCQPILRIEEE